MFHRIRAIVEVLIGFIAVFGYIWLIYPLYHLWIKIVAAIPILAFFVVANLGKQTRLQDLGLRWDNWADSGKILLVFTVVTIPVFYGIWSLFFPIDRDFYTNTHFWTRLLIYPFWAFFQQYAVLVFFFRRFRKIFSPHSTLAILCSAGTFALMHIPTLPLLIFCFGSGIVWAGTYHKYPNLYTTAISHAILGTFCSYVLLVYCNVGPDADLGRWSKKQPPIVRGAIERVNTLTLDRKARLVRISHGTESLEVEGWVATREHIKQIQLSLGGNTYAVNYGVERQDIAARFKNPEYLSSGFHTTIPISALAHGYHPLQIKVSLHGGLFHHSPGKKMWVKIQ